MDEENNSQGELTEDRRWTGGDELFSAIGAAIASAKGKEAIAALIKSYADDLPKRSQRAISAVRWAYGLAGTAIVAIGLLGYLKVITGETTGALMGTVAASLFYRRSSN